MKNSIVILLLVAFTACKTSSPVVASFDKKACKYFNEKISLVEDFNNQVEGYSNELISASNFLSEVTEIKPESNYSYEGLGFDASNQDLSQWKSWFKNNKHLLYWDKDEKTVKVKKSDFIVALK